MLIDRYQDAILEVIDKVRTTQRENIERVGELIATAIANGGQFYVAGIVHGIEGDIYNRGGGPAFVQKYSEETELKAGDVLIVSSVSGRTKRVVDLAYDAMGKGVNVIALISMSYAATVDPVHESGKKLYEFVSAYVDNCAPPAEAMLEVEGIEARFAACSGISSAYILWSILSVTVEAMLRDGRTPGILKSANTPGGADYNNAVIYPQYKELGW